MYEKEMFNVKLNFIKNTVKRDGMIDIGKMFSDKPLYLMTNERAVKCSGFGQYTSQDHAKEFFKDVGGEYDFYILIPRLDKPTFHGFNEDEFNDFITPYLSMVGVS